MSTCPNAPARIAAAAVWASVAVILIVATGAWSLRFDPPRAIYLPGAQTPLPELCGSRRWFAIDCPGCGLTRSFVLSAHGQWAQAWRIHPVGTLVFASSIALLPYRFWQGWRIAAGRPPRSTTTAELLALALLIGLNLLWWVLRMAHDQLRSAFPS